MAKAPTFCMHLKVRRSTKKVRHLSVAQVESILRDVKDDSSLATIATDAWLCVIPKTDIIRMDFRRER